MRFRLKRKLSIPLHLIPCYNNFIYILHKEDLMNPICLNDFLNYRFLSRIKYAPGGQSAAFVVSNCCEDENRYESRLWLYDGTLRQLTDLGSESSFIWEDDTHILFPAVRSSKEKKRQESKDAFTSYYRLNIHGGEAIPAFTLPVTATQIEKVGDNYAFLARIDANYPDYYCMSDEERRDVAKHYDEEKDYEVLDERPFWFNDAGMVNKRRTALFTRSAEGTVTRITAPLFDVSSMTVIDGNVYFSGYEFSTKRPERTVVIYCLNLASGKVSTVVERPDLKIGSVQRVGHQLWIGASEGKRHGLNENSWVYTLDVTSGELSLLREEEYNMYNSVGSDCRYGGGSSWQEKDGALYHLATREGSGLLYRLSADGSSTPIITKDGSIDSFSLCEESGEALMIAMYDNKLQELYAANLATGAIRQLSNFNTNVLKDKYVAEYHPVSVDSDGYRISGWVLLPDNFDPAKKYPAVLDIHGGPKTVYGPVFYHEMQLWANMGYIVFFCNPKGGDGRDNDFMDIRGHYGETDYRNLMDFTDAVIAAYPQIDQSRICVTGGSYGGFMTNWIIGHTDRFCCAASQRSISNWISFFGVSDIGYSFAVDQCDGNPFDDHEKLWALSPLRYAKNVKTPTLFIHSDEDYRCPLAEGLQMYTALADLGVPTRLCMFHGENHELSRSGKPKHRVRRLTEITQWFEKYSR